MKRILKLLLILQILVFAACNKNNNLDTTKIQQGISGTTKVQQGISGTTEDLLWNQGMLRRNYLHLQCTETSCNDELPIKLLSDLSEPLPGKPSGVWPWKYQVNDNSWIQAADSSAPSVRLIALGYPNAQFGTYPGYDIDINGGYGTPIEFNLKNNAKSFTPAAVRSQLREVGLVFGHWPTNPGLWSFRKQYKLGDFSDIQGNFDSFLDYFSAPINYTNTVYATADLRLTYYDSTGQAVRGELVGVIFSNPNNYDINGNPNDAIYWQGFTNNGQLEMVNGVPYARILLHGDKIGIPAINSSSYSNILINYRSLIENFLPPPPPGFTHDDAVIVGWDVYSSVRGYDFQVRLKNVKLFGVY